MRILALGCLVLGACRSQAPEVDAGADDRIRLATFNVRRFFDTVCESGRCDSSEDYETVPSQAYFDLRADQLATAIARLDADVIALQEIETQACLDALLSRLADDLPHGVLGETYSTASVDVAVLSRTPIDKVTGHRMANLLTLPDGTITTFSRELLEVQVRAADGTKVVMFAAHFRSKSNDDPARRLAEAQVASRVIGTVAAGEPEALVVLGGDLNDTPGSPPLEALTVTGGLIRVADDLATAAQATYRFGGRGQAIDHLLLAPGSAAFRIPLSSRAWTEVSGWGGSDHSALTSDFRRPPP